MDTVTVKLNYPTAFDGVVRDSLTLRRPKVRDMRAAQKVAAGDEDGQELALFAALAEVAPSDLEGMDLDDYHRLQDAYFRFRTPRQDQSADAQKTGEAPADRASDVTV
ncbi:tail assembly chaperone E/41/14-like protein [Paraburkholderia sp. BL8N3]|nr:phage tail assembly protein [Paraburkholderia sp. BL8N3]TCK43478.1 tail assembly chaperone E/41/14-like protein [Paraburkholderia sp. BL8N3]